MIVYMNGKINKIHRLYFPQLSEMKIEVFHRETIKPSSPTPHHLRSFKLCLMDQHAGVMYISIVLFYPNIDADGNVNIAAERSQLLKKTLPETLAHFYPLAGRIRNNLYVECNDEGAEFVEARINCSISKILENPDVERLKEFLPIDIASKEAETGTLLLVQATLFECGGLAIGVSMSHKVSDAASLCTFIISWSSIALGGSNEPLFLPEFAGASLIFPPREHLGNSSESKSAATFKWVRNKCLTRRFVFDASKIAALQRKVASESVKNPTRVEAVSALIWKCAMEASRATRGSARPSTLMQCVNIRSRMLPALPETYLGNLIDFFAVRVEGGENDKKEDLQGLVGMLRNGIQGFKEEYDKGVETDKVIEKKLEGFVKLPRIEGLDNYNFTSVCRFPLYKADFGWGKPRWVSYASVEIQNVIKLISTRDETGIEAWLILREEDMALVENNPELLAFATLNPTAM